MIIQIGMLPPCNLCSDVCRIVPPRVMQTYLIFGLIFAWPCIIDINNIDNQLDATVTAY
jgi:hypothetical protein